jgi:pyruvate-ferredoxin/flavodoxin oxidoreductase
MPGIAAPTERSTVSRRIVKFPGIRTTADGSEAVVWVEARLSQAAGLYLTPPSNRMAERFAGAAARGRRNLWGDVLRVIRSESGHGAASACAGFALAGGRVTSFASGQELVNMAEVLCSAAGKRLPMTFHVAARALASQAASIQAGHDDIMLVADCGWGLLFARNAQEAADFAVIARRAAELSETPFLNAQDSYITTHTVETVLLPEPELMKVFVGPPSRRLRALFDPKQPLVSGPLANQDSYMKGRVAQRFFYERVRPSIETAMADYFELTGRRYGLVRPYRMEDAEYAVIGLGSMMDTAEATVDELRSRGTRVGAVTISCFRPFPQDELVRAIARCRAVAVIERTDTPLAESNPLTIEVKSGLASAQMGDDARLLRVPEVYSGAAGLGGRPITPGSIAAAVENMQQHGRRRFVLGVKHPDALSPQPEIDIRPHGAFSVRIHSLGGFGAVTASRIMAAAAAEIFHTEVQASADYSGEKRGLPASLYLTLAPKRVQSQADPTPVEMVAIQHAEAFRAADPLHALAPGGFVYLQSDAPAEDVWATLPAGARRTVRERRLQLFVLDARKLARECAPAPELAGRMQSMAMVGAFLRILPHREGVRIPDEQLFASLEALIEEHFGETGTQRVKANLQLARFAYDQVRRIDPPEEVADYQTQLARAAGRDDLHPAATPDWIPSGFCERILRNYIEGREGILESDLYIARSLVPAGSSRYRSFRHLTAEIPRFDALLCTGCMECVNLCPDAAISARVVEPETLERTPEELHQQFSFTAKYYENFLKRGEAGGLFALYIDADRCKGCGGCVEVCGARQALRMAAKTQAGLESYDRARDFFETLPETPARFIGEKTLGGILLSSRAGQYAGGAGSCAGCGESTAIRLLLAATAFAYGQDRIGVVAATGCHIAAATTYPFNPYGVSWTNAQTANAPAEATGIRVRWDLEGHSDRRLWVIGAEDALLGGGRQSLEQMLAARLDIKVLVLDKSALSPIGDLGTKLLLHANTLVAQTSAAHLNHFYKCILAANEYTGPAVVICYSACTTDHGIADGLAAAEAKLAVDTRTFPLFLSDPRSGERLRDRLDLRGNPALRDDWYRDPKTFDPIGFLLYARSEGRYRSHFDAAGEPDEYLREIERRALENWRALREIGGLR